MASSIPCPANVIPECTQTGSSGLCTAQHSQCHRHSDCHTQTQTHTFRPSWGCMLGKCMCALSIQLGSIKQGICGAYCGACPHRKNGCSQSEGGALGRAPPSVVPNMHSLFRLHTKGIQSRLKDDGIWLLSLYLRKESGLSWQHPRFCALHLLRMMQPNFHQAKKGTLSAWQDGQQHLSAHIWLAPISVEQRSICRGPHQLLIQGI